MIKQSDKDLAAELVKRGHITQAVSAQLLQSIENSTKSLKDQLLETNALSEKVILEALSTTLNLEFIDLKRITVQQAVLDKIPVRFAWFFKFLPISIVDKKLTLATSAPLNIKFQDEIRVHLGLEPKMVLASEADILEALNKYYGLAADTVDKLAKEAERDGSSVFKTDVWIEDLEKETDDASISKLVNEILLEAYKKRATDIHIEPYREKVRIRYRIDGVLMDANIPSAVKELLPSVISRIKIMANISIVEKRLPQDGAAVVKTKEQDLDMRISTIPTPRGESMVIRILPVNVRLLSLEKLGLDPKNLKIFREIVKKPNGIILVTGPTGSGKTTTLYACLNEVNSSDRKIITLEDPIECEMEGITQIQVNPKVDMDFAAGLRSTLRHDPDIIMVGEIRDLETAEISIRTALTGHIVFSTLHTNDAASGITRLIEMGLEPFLVASSVEAFVAQRLVRIICPQCKEEISTPLLDVREEIASSLGIKVKEVKIFTGRGCDHCNKTGFRGRTAIYEVLLISDNIRAAILDKQRASYIKTLAMHNGMRTLRQDGWQKVVDGVTAPSEVVNTTMKDEEIFAAEKGKSTVEAGTQKPVDKKQEEPKGADQKKTPAPIKVRQVDPKILSSKEVPQDARAYARVDIKLPMRYAIVRQDKENPGKIITENIEHSSVTKDISAGGVRFVSGYALRAGTILELRIQTKKDERSVDCLARVCRVEEDSLSAMFSVVAYYLDLSSANRVRLDNFVNTKLKEQEKNT